MLMKLYRASSGAVHTHSLCLDFVSMRTCTDVSLAGITVARSARIDTSGTSDQI